MRFRNDAASINVYLFVVNGCKFKNPRKFAPQYARFAQKCGNHPFVGKKYPQKWNDIHFTAAKKGGQRGFLSDRRRRIKKGYSVVLRSPTGDGAALRPLR